MDRRSALGLLAATAAVASTPDQLLTAGRSLHRRIVSGPRRVLNAQQDASLLVLTDLILPATDTPGAKAAGVNAFIDLLLADWVDPEDRDRFLKGLADVDTRARAAFGKDFIQGTTDQQTALLVALDDEAARWKASPEATRGPEPFYRTLKWATLFGYFTSETGALQEEHYAIIPGRYVPCAPADTLSPSE